MIFNMVGGGAGGAGGGATLVVSSPANVSVTVSKDDKSYTKNSGSLGSTTFKGLATGTWTVTISGNGQTATKTIEITADYAITIAFFSASINITYPATSTCVVTNSSGQTVASNSNTGSSTKTWTATVSATGTYTVTATATDGSGKSKSQSVSITADGQSESVTLRYRTDIIKAGVLQTTKYSLYNATASTKSGIWKITGKDEYHFAANFEFNSAYIGGTVFVEVTAGKASGESQYTSGILLNTSPVSSSSGKPAYVAQTIFTIKSSAIQARTYELKIPDGFNSGYISIHAEPDFDGYISISNMWVE